MLKVAMDDEARILGAADRAFAEAFHKADGLVVCGPGCADCCHRPFAIAQTDAARLRRGLRELPEAAASAIRTNAQRRWQAMSPDFPGDAATGALDPSPAWRDWFFARHAGPPCPALDPIARTCLLHAHRPVACRLYGPLIRIGESRSDPCPKNYAGVAPARVEAMGVTVGEPLLAHPGNEGETIVAFALL